MDLELLLADPFLEETITECLFSAEYYVLSCAAVKVRNTLIRPAPGSALAAHNGSSRQVVSTTGL